MNTDGKQRWMDDVLRRVAEENMNPDDRSLGMRRALTAEEEAMSQAVLAEREEPYMGNLGRAIGAIRDFKFPSGPQVPLAGIRGVTPTVGAGDLPNVAKDMALPLLASDLGAAGTMANVPIPFPGMGKKPAQAGAKKFVPRKKPYINKTDPITEATSKISDDYQFLDPTRKSKVARAGLSKGRYQQLLDDGYDFDDIIREYPRLGPDEWVDIEDVAGRPETFKTSPTPKTKRKPFDEYTRDRSPESYINPSDTELQKEFAEIASAQRGAPEKIMLKITSIDKGMGEKEYTFISEHIGDLYNRMTQPGNMAQSFGTITDKFKKVKLNLSPKSNATLPKYVKRIKEEMPEVVELLDEFADAHAAVDISTSMGVAKPVQLARDAAVAYGKLDLDEAVRLLKELEPYMEDRNLFKKAMFNFGRQSPPTPKIARKPQTELGSHYGRLADESGYTKHLTGGDPELTQQFYDILDWKYMNEPYIGGRGLNKGVDDVHELYQDITNFAANPTNQSPTIKETMNFNKAVNEKNASKLFENENLDDLLG